jgi:hypothetical protein
LNLHRKVFGEVGEVKDSLLHGRPVGVIPITMDSHIIEGMCLVLWKPTSWPETFRLLVFGPCLLGTTTQALHQVSVLPNSDDCEVGIHGRR